jgi:TRAP-type C4-dicarboxylate transport system substrate-binding protein
MIAIGQARARYMANLRYRYVVGGLVFSQAAWERLTSSQRSTVLEVCRAWEPKLRKSWRKETERGLATISKSGVILRSATEAQLAAFRDGLITSRTPTALEAEIRAAREPAR